MTFPFLVFVFLFLVIEIFFLVTIFVYHFQVNFEPKEKKKTACFQLFKNIKNIFSYKLLSKYNKFKMKI